MTRKIFFLFILSAICKHPIEATLHPSACHFGIEFEYLCLKPDAITNTFATEVISDTENKSLINSPHYSSGFRIEGAYAWNCQNAIHGRFTYFNSGRNKRSVTSTFTTFTGTIEDELEFRYYAAELLLGRWLYDCDFGLELEAGLLYSNIEFNEFVSVFGPQTPFAQGRTQSKFWGVGPEIVLDFQYPLPCMFAIAFNAREALLISRVHSFTFGVDNFNFFSDPIFEVIPTSDLRMGLNWARRCSCYKLNIEAGYEWIYYHKAVMQIGAAENVSFHGPYFLLGLAY